MPKPITLDMLHLMSPDQLKTLKQNAMHRDTPASRDVLQLLAQDDVAARFIKAPAKSTLAKSAAAKSAAAKSAAAKSAGVKPAAKPSARRALTGSKAASAASSPAPKAVQAKHGRQS